MDHQKVFSTHIFVKDNYLAPQRLPAMQEEIKNLYKHTTNFQTGPNLDQTEPFKWFASDIGKTAFDIFDKLNYNVQDIEITGMWGNILKTGETHPPHTHSNNFLSGTYYLQSDQGASIVFHDPRPAADVIVPRKKEKNTYNSSLLSYASRTNRAIFFPAWLPHWVQQNKSNNKRISIAWNMQVKGQVGEHHEFQSANF